MTISLDDGRDLHGLVDRQPLGRDRLARLRRWRLSELGEQLARDGERRRLISTDLVLDGLQAAGRPSGRRPAGRSARKCWLSSSAGGAWRIEANSSRFMVISLAPNVATISSRREPSWSVTVVVGPNGTPWSAATISLGRSVGDRS